MNEEHVQANPEIQPTTGQNTPEKQPKDFSYNEPGKNIQEMRQLMKEAQERADRAEEYARQLQQKDKPAQEDYEISGDDDALTEIKQLKKIDKKHAKSNEDVRKELNKLKDYIDEQFVRTKYPDIEKLTEKENIEKFARQSPALYRSIMANPSLRDRGEALGEQIQIMLKNDNKYQDEERRVADLKSKPKPVSAVGSAASITPLAAYDPNVRITLTAEDKKEVMRQAHEMKKRQGRAT